MLKQIPPALDGRNGQSTRQDVPSVPRLIDLTLTLRHEMRGVQFETLHIIDEHGWNSRILHLYSHCGTHMDAPRHFLPGGRTIDRIPLEHCLGPAWVVDLSGLDDRTSITVDHLGAVAEQIEPGDGLLLRTDWDRHVDRPQHYRDDFPRVSLELAEWCAERRLRLLGVEAPSVADVNDLDEVTAVHQVLLEAGILVVEGLSRLGGLRGDRVFFGALPLKIEAGDGAPCRAFAIEACRDGFPGAWRALQAGSGE